MSVDSTKRKLKMPPWHIPYMEKHRIYELFNELGRELLIQQPIDHVVFLKRILQIAVCNRDSARVILICSPSVNSQLLAKRIANHTGLIVITDDTITEAANKKNRAKMKPLTVARVLHNLTTTEEGYKNGWILADVIKSEQEAKLLVNHGLSPTHVLHVISAKNPPLDEPIYCDVPEIWPKYRRSVVGIRRVYYQLLQEIHINDREMKDIVAECIEVVSNREIKAPRKTRLCLLGPRGSGRKTLAKMIQQKLNLVHVDFESILCEAWHATSTALGKAIRNVKDDLCFDVGLLATVVNERLLRNDCLQQGYVLTGYPNTVDDFKCLDKMDTPPNRVVFLECDLDTCRMRLINRKVNVYTGSTWNIVEHPERVLGKKVLPHPKDKIEVINAELKYYVERLESLKSYCGQTAQIVENDEDIHCAFDHLCKIVMNSAPPASKLRDPYTTTEKEEEHKVIVEGDSSNCSLNVDVEDGKHCVMDFRFW